MIRLFSQIWCMISSPTLYSQVCLIFLTCCVFSQHAYNPVFSTLRLFALSGRNALLTALIAVLSLGLMCTNLVNRNLLHAATTTDIHRSIASAEQSHRTHTIRIWAASVILLLPCRPRPLGSQSHFLFCMNLYIFTADTAQ